MRRLRTLIQALVLCLVTVTSGDAASFSCTPYFERRVCPEVLICSEPNLSRLDDVMASLYEDARRRMPTGFSTGFRDYQREWLAKRANCGCNYECLERQYRSQIEALRRTINQMNQ